MKHIKLLIIFLLFLASFTLSAVAQVNPFDYSLSDDNEKACLIDYKGKKLTDFLYDDIKYIGDGYYVVEQKEKFGIVDYKGRKIIETIYNDKDFYTNDSIQYLLNRNYKDTASYKIRFSHTWRGLFVNYGRAFYFTKTLSSKLPVYQVFLKNNTLDFISIAYKGPNNYNDNYGLEFNYFMPVTHINDVKSKLWGFQLAYYSGVDLVYIKNFDVPLGFGLNYGCMYYQSDNKKFYNPELSLKLRIEPRFVYKRFIIHASFGAQWDMSKPVWKSHHEPFTSSFRQNLVNVSAGVAYMIFDYKSSNIRVY